MNEAPYISIRNITKSYEAGRIQALRGVTLSVSKGEFVSIMGPSGCGKSTLLHIISALETPDTGEVLIDNMPLNTQKNVSKFRSETVGIIFQLHNLIPTLTASENVQLPMFETGSTARERRERSEYLLGLVGLENQFHTLSNKLSGGERLRVAIARALANNPSIVIADEPTGSLDSQTAHAILDLLQHVHQKTDNTMIMVTHDASVAAKADRTIQMLDGKIIS